MAKRTAANTGRKAKTAPAPPKRASAKAGKAGQPKVVVLAEKLGSFLGRARKQADALLGKVARKGTAKSAKKRGVAAADAPIKRLRKPPPQELFDPRLGEPMGKQMGNKNLKRRGPG